MKNNNIITKKSLAFLESYINNASPTGFESEGQKMWLNYLKPYIDTHIVDTYGTVVGVINPDAKRKIVGVDTLLESTSILNSSAAIPELNHAS